MKCKWLILLSVFFVLPILYAQDKNSESDFVTGLSEINDSSMVFYFEDVQSVAA